jgi:E3 ubiquitin-protein ligase RBBP6
MPDQAKTHVRAAMPSSVVHYKFRNAAGDSRTIEFEGPWIALNDLKRRIETDRHLDSKQRRAAFDFQLTDAISGRSYDDSNWQIPRDSSVIVRRIPAAANTQNNRFHYEKSFTNNSQRFSFPRPCAPSKTEDFGTSLFSNSSIEAPAAAEEDDEDKRMNQIVSMASVSYPAQRKPPPKYVCHRCGQPGHFIKECPTNNNSAFDDRRQRRVTAAPIVPSIFMAPVEEPGVPTTGNRRRPVIFTATRDANLEPDAIPICAICDLPCQEAMIATCCGRRFCGPCILGRIFGIEKSVCPSCGVSIAEEDLIMLGHNASSGSEGHITQPLRATGGIGAPAIIASLPLILPTVSVPCVLAEPERVQYKHAMIISRPMTPPRAQSLFAQHGRESFFKMYAGPHPKTNSN